MQDVISCAESIFEQPWWLETVAPGQWHEAIVEERGEIVARLPYFLQKKWYGNSIIMPPLTQTLGPWMKDREPLAGNSHLGYQKEWIAKLIKQLPKTTKCEMTLDSANNYILPYRWHGFSITPNFSYRIDNLSDLDALYKKFNKTAKKNINYARNKVSINSSNDINILLSLVDETFAVQKRKNPIGSELVKRVFDACQSHNAAKLLVATDAEGNHHSCGLFIFDKQVCYYLMGGTSTAYRNSGAQNLVLWAGIQFAATASKSFDFEGSMVEGIENFFRQFGGKQVINYHISKSALPFEVMGLMKPRVKKLFKYKI